jgi:protocatechuate 3,4-dioxygenase beta subunit
MTTRNRPFVDDSYPASTEAPLVDTSRRRFLIGSALVLAAGSTGVAGAQQMLDGRTPFTRKQLDAFVNRMGGATLSCVRTPETNEGPFYYESSLERRSLVEGHQGVPLRLGIVAAGVVGQSACLPLSGAVVDVWQTDGLGLYSNVGHDLQTVDTTAQTFLRGHQITDESGYVEFDTVVPGWELVPAPEPLKVLRRTTHIHVKVFHERQVVTTQLYLPDPLLDELYAGVEPYKSHRQMTAPGLDRYYERVRNHEDLIFPTDQARPLEVERSAKGLFAKAIIGFAGTMGNRGYSSRWK